jgi:hypothetical protein
MKNKITAILAALISASYVSAIEVNENLSINGFLDGSYSHTDTDRGGAGGTDSQSLGLDEAELDFLFNAGGVSGELHLDNDNGNGPNDRNFDIEQVHMSYTLDNGLSVTFGRFGSALGFEREDPGGLYTYSRAYSSGSAFNLGNVDNTDTVQEGARFGWSSDQLAISASLTNGQADSATLEENDLDLELAFSYTGIENLAIGGGAFFDNDTSNANEADAINLHLAYTAGKALVGFEYTEIDPGNSSSADLEAYQLIVDYDVSDKLGVALRYSSEELGANTDYDKITIAPNYAITESLGAILEYSDIDNANIDSDLIAVELTFTF